MGKRLIHGPAGHGDCGRGNDSALSLPAPSAKMRAMSRFIPLLLLLELLTAGEKLSAQGTAFSYQGRLSDGGAPANGSYDLRFAVYDSVTNGTQVSAWLTNAAVPVSNGLFTTTLDFGPGLFTGPDRWLDIAVRATNTAAFTALAPRQPILPVPYAVFANGASNVLGPLPAAQLTGTVGSGQIAGTYANAVNFSSGGNNFAGAFAGNGGSLSNLNGSQITSGTVADARLSANVSLLNQSQTNSGNNTFTGNNQFNGANSFTNWANSFTGSFFGNGLVGWITTNGLAVPAERDHGYLLTSAGLATVTLPANSGLTNGDIVRVSGAGAGGWLVKANPGQSIAGNLASYANCVFGPIATTGDFSDVAASADGGLIYVVGGSFTGVKSAAAPRWVLGNAGALVSYYNSVACSANGRIVYAQPTSGAILKSTNSGASWFSTGFGATGNFISCSADGSQLYTGGYACSGNGTYLAKLSGATIAISTNGGTNFPISVATPVAFNCLAVSGDCVKLIGGANPGLLYASANRGATWTALTQTNQHWSGAWMSPDGSKLAVSVKASTIGGSDGSVAWSAVQMLPGAASTNGVSGGPGGAVELQYLGNGQFMPVSSAGVIWAN